MRAQVWGIMLGATALGVAGSFLWPPAVVILTAAGYFVATFKTFGLNVPENRLAIRSGQAFHAAAVYWVTGSLQLTVAAALLAFTMGLPSQFPRTSKVLHPMGLIGPMLLLVGGIFAAANAYAAQAPLLYLVPSGLTSVFFMIAAVIPTVRDGRKTKQSLRVPQAGAEAPDFELPTRDGSTRLRLSDRGGFVLLCFLRGDWCPFCQVLMRVYRREAPRLKERGVELIVVTPSGGPEAVEFAKTIGLDYTVLFDEKGDVAKLYGTFAKRTAEEIEKDPRVGIVPVSFLIGPDMTVRFASEPDSVTYFGDDGFDRLLQAA